MTEIITATGYRFAQIDLQEILSGLEDDGNRVLFAHITSRLDHAQEVRKLSGFMLNKETIEDYGR